MKMLQIATLLVLLLMLNCTSTKWRGSVGTTTGGYVYTLDNPIRMIDLDGRKWDESSVTQKNGNVTINLTLTVAILNSSNKKFDLKKLGNVLSSQLQSSYGISYVEGMNYETENTY